MPIPDKPSRLEGAPIPEPEPSGVSRRSMLRGAASAGAAGLAITALASPALAASRHGDLAGVHADEAAGSAAADIADAEPVVAHVRDARTGEIDVYRGTSHVRIQDRTLAARLTRAGTRTSK